jgi:hypothetical protein
MPAMPDYTEGLKKERERQKMEQEAFLAEFNRLKHDVIWPVIVDIGNELTKYGHDFHVSEEKEYTDAVASYHPSSITFNLYPLVTGKTFKRPESTPYVSFVADRYAQKVLIMVSTMMPGQGGVIGQHGSYDIEKITTDFVEKEIIEVLKNSLILHKS